MNNPMNAVDPDGNAPWLVGAVVGAVVEYGVQVGTNMYQGKSFAQAISPKNIDWADVGVAAAAGAASCGLSAVVGKSVASAGVKLGAEMAMAGSVNMAAKSVQNAVGIQKGKNTASRAVFAAATGVAGAGAGNWVSSGLKSLAKTAKTGARKAVNAATAGRSRGAQAARAAKATTRLTIANFRSDSGVEAESATSVIGSANEFINNEDSKNNNANTHTKKKKEP